MSVNLTADWTLDIRYLFFYSTLKAIGAITSPNTPKLSVTEHPEMTQNVVKKKLGHPLKSKPRLQIQTGSSAT